MNTNFTYEEWKKKRITLLKIERTAKYTFKEGKELSSAHYCSMCGRLFTRYNEKTGKHCVRKPFIWINNAGFVHVNLCLRLDTCYNNMRKKAGLK